MDEAAQALEFEKAARYRNTIARVRRVQSEQVMESDSADLDAIAVFQQSGGVCVAVLSVRGGRVLGVNSQFPDLGLFESPEEILDAFIPQYYLSSGRSIPTELICSHQLNEAALVADAFSHQCGRKVRITHAVRGVRQQFLDLAKTNAEESLALRLATRDGQAKRLNDFAERFALDIPERIECFDISHTSGEATVASCVVFDVSGPLKSDYRIFNITDVQAGDDYGAMRQALSRRYRRVKSGEIPLPDVLIIDGGKGQLTEAIEILSELGIHDIFVLGISKGPSRRAGFELLHRADTGEELTLPSTSPALHLIQHIRDEAHRFAITKHRQSRSKSRSQSPLEGYSRGWTKEASGAIETFWRYSGTGSCERLGYSEGCRDESSNGRVGILCAAHRLRHLCEFTELFDLVARFANSRPCARVVRPDAVLRRNRSNNIYWGRLDRLVGRLACSSLGAGVCVWCVFGSCR